MSEHTNPVMVTTSHRGVFFGYLDDRQPNAETKTVTVARARNCGYWSRSMGGFVGLATVGPDAECRIGPAAPEMMIYDVTSIVTCTPEAATRWEEGRWSR